MKKRGKNLLLPTSVTCLVLMCFMAFSPVRIELCKFTNYALCLAIPEKAWNVEYIDQPGSQAKTIRKTL